MTARRRRRRRDGDSDATATAAAEAGQEQTQYVGGCQNYDPLLGTLNMRCRRGSQKGTIILTTTHVRGHWASICESDAGTRCSSCNSLSMRDPQLSCSLNSSKGGYMRDIMGEYWRLTKGDTRSLVYGSNQS